MNRNVYVHYHTDGQHLHRLAEILGISIDLLIGNNKQFELNLDAAIDATWARLFPSHEDLQVQQEWDEHNAERNC